MSGERLAVQAARGFAWSFAAMAVARVVSLAGLAVLARLLAPADFGLLAFALVYVTYAETVSDLGLGSALVYSPTREEDAAQVTFGLGLALGFAWFLLTQALAPVVAAFFATPDAESILRVLAWSFPLRALGGTHDALCQKALRFRARFAPELGLAAAKAVVSVLLAWHGWGVWSLVWGQLAGILAWTALLWVVVPWRPARRWPRDLVRPLVAYGRGIVAVNVLGAVTHHADLVVVGKVLGSLALGFYQLAYKLPEATISVLFWLTSRVLFPTLARFRAEGRAVAGGYLAAQKYVSLATVPLALGLGLLAGPLVRVAFGAAWTPSVPILQALAVYAGLRSLSTPAGDVLKALGRPGLLAALGLARALALVPAMVAAAPTGAAAVAGMLAAVTGLFLLLNVGAACRLAGVSASELASSLRPSLLAGAVLAAWLLAWERLAAGAPDWVAVAVGAGVGAGAYLGAIQAVSPAVSREVRALFPDLRRSPAR